MRPQLTSALPHPENTVYLIDSSIYIYRAWHLHPKSVCARDGSVVNALHGFALFLCELLAQTRAQHLLCALDHESRPTRRQQLYPRYKSDRRPTPAALRTQFALCRQLLALMGIPHLSVARYEADDIIATLAAHSRGQGRQACIVSADKDLTQCLQAGDSYWDFARRQRIDSRGVEKRFGVKPAQIADLLALSGDKADSIVGVPGIGTATAARLLKKWGNIDLLFDQLERVATMKFRGAAGVAALLAEHEQAVRDARRVCGLFTIEGLEQQSTRLATARIDRPALQRFLHDTGFSPPQQSTLLTTLESLQ